MHPKKIIVRHRKREQAIGLHDFAAAARIESVAPVDISGSTGVPGNCFAATRPIEAYKSELSEEDGAVSPAPGSTSNRI